MENVAFFKWNKSKRCTVPFELCHSQVWRLRWKSISPASDLILKSPLWELSPSALLHGNMKQVSSQGQRWESTPDQGAAGSEDKGSEMRVSVCVCSICVWIILSELKLPICEKFWWIKFVTLYPWRNVDKVVERSRGFPYFLLLKYELVLGSAAPTSPGGLLEVQNFRLDPWLAESECAF